MTAREKALEAASRDALALLDLEARQERCCCPAIGPRCVCCRLRAALAMPQEPDGCEGCGADGEHLASDGSCCNCGRTAAEIAALTVEPDPCREALAPVFPLNTRTNRILADFYEDSAGQWWTIESCGFVLEPADSTRLKNALANSFTLLPQVQQ